MKEGEGIVPIKQVLVKEKGKLRKSNKIVLFLEVICYNY